MKKLWSALGLLAFALPVLADPAIDRWNTHHSMGCMLVRDCKEGVVKMNSADQLGETLGMVFTEEESEELGNIFDSSNKIGIEIFVAEGKYFPSRVRGVYYTVGNKFFLNGEHMVTKDILIEVLRHEGWHAAQDCMAGSIENNSIAVIWNDGVVPQGYRLQADIAYAAMPAAVPWEAEAFYAADSPWMTADALAACANENKKMWDVYSPTPMTGEWLIENGYWDGVTR